MKARSVWKILQDTYPDATCALHHGDPWQLLVATILSAQCTDERVNIVTKDLFKKYKSPQDFLNVPVTELEQDIKSTGFFRNKAKNIRAAAGVVVDRHAGQVPRTQKELVELPGVGRKTANVVLGNAFDTPGITVDTHVGRLSRRIGFTKNEDPVKVEFDLMELIPEEDWTKFSHAMIFHGRQICHARKPNCHECPVAPHCDAYPMV
ncbi:MAG: endonuclease III [Deltaproteobacteria bacterium]|nr:endonuclease III [Deltaproteobacteria bacterium]MCB9487717.1 endonuclease III [Deltaproteobacteria bacterium]